MRQADWRRLARRWASPELPHTGSLFAYLHGQTRHLAPCTRDACQFVFREVEKQLQAKPQHPYACVGCELSLKTFFVCRGTYIPEPPFVNRFQEGEARPETSVKDPSTHKHCHINVCRAAVLRPELYNQPCSLGQNDNDYGNHDHQYSASHEYYPMQHWPQNPPQNSRRKNRDASEVPWMRNHLVQDDNLGRCLWHYGSSLREFWGIIISLFCTTSVPASCGQAATGH